MSLNKEEIAQCLIQAGLDLTARKKALKEIDEAEQAKKEERESGKGPKSKNKLTIVVRGDENLEKVLAAGWVIKTPVDQDDNEVIKRITIGAARHNAMRKKRQKNIIKSFSDFFLLAKRKFTKEPEVSIQPLNKDAVRVVVIKDENIDFNK